MTQPRKRYVTVRLGTREKSDPRAILDAVREALRGHGVVLRAVDKPDDPQEATDVERRVAQEQLEAAALKLAASHLEEKARQLAECEDEGEEGRRPRPAPPGAIAKIRTAIWQWLKVKTKAGWRITVETALEWASKKMTGQP